MSNDDKSKGSDKPRAAWRDRIKTAGPDDPIYKGGLRVTLGRPEPFNAETPYKGLLDPLPELNTNFAQLAEEIKKQVFDEAQEQFGDEPEEPNSQSPDMKEELDEYPYSYRYG